MAKKRAIYVKSELLLTVATILALLIGVSRSIAAPPFPENDSPFEAINLSPEAQSLPANFVANVPVKGNPKFDSALTRVADAAQVSMAEALNEAQSLSFRLSGDRVQVYIVARPLSLKNVIEVVTNAGGEVTRVGKKDTLIQGWLPLDKLRTVAAHDDIYFIRRPAEAHLGDDLSAISATTEGLVAINAQAWHAAGYTGAGVKIGIIDDGFLGYAGLLGTDLPASVIVKNFVDGETDAEVNGTTNHGTAVAEIVHDIAPDAQIYLAKVRTSLELGAAVDWLKDVHQVDLISTSLSWYNQTRGDGTGYLADFVNQARTADILWTTAASNNRETHWGGLYSDPDADNLHNFNSSQEVNYFGPGDGTAYLIPSGLNFEVYVRWNDWTAVDQDYDLYLLRWDGSSWQTVESSANYQDGSPGQRPTEHATVETSGEDTAYGFYIERYDSNRNVNFEIFAFPRGGRLDELLHARSLANLADAPDALTVAALDVTPPYSQEPYSSEGPTNGPGGAETDGFIKPDIAAYANVSTESKGVEGFAGTSAATPHVAGAAALVLSAYPGYTPDQVQSFLEGRAIDMGAAGMDTRFGHGRLYLGDPPMANDVCYDFDGSGIVDVPDLDQGASLWRQLAGPPYDCDGDGRITVKDIICWAKHLGEVCDTPPPPSQADNVPCLFVIESLQDDIYGTRWLIGCVDLSSSHSSITYRYDQHGRIGGFDYTLSDDQGHDVYRAMVDLQYDQYGRIGSYEGTVSGDEFPTFTEIIVNEYNEHGEVGSADVTKVYTATGDEYTMDLTPCDPGSGEWGGYRVNVRGGGFNGEEFVVGDCD